MSRLVLHHPELIALYRLWFDQCRNETLPSSADLAPNALRRWLDNLVVIDPRRDGRLRYSYYGANLAAAFGTDMLGKSIDQLPETQQAVLRQEYDRIVADRLPRAREYRADFGSGPQCWERLSLTFFGPDEEVEKILVAAYRLD